MHEYYTLIDALFQGFLDKITIFVNYADIYVNMFMLTELPTDMYILSFSTKVQYVVVRKETKHKIWICKISFVLIAASKYYLPTAINCTF